jgi:hypothetical protein
VALSANRGLRGHVLDQAHHVADPLRRGGEALDLEIGGAGVLGDLADDAARGPRRGCRSRRPIRQAPRLSPPPPAHWPRPRQRPRRPRRPAHWCRWQGWTANAPSRPSSVRSRRKRREFRRSSRGTGGSALRCAAGRRAVPGPGYPAPICGSRSI